MYTHIANPHTHKGKRTSLKFALAVPRLLPLHGLGTWDVRQLRLPINFPPLPFLFFLFERVQNSLPLWLA